MDDESLEVTIVEVIKQSRGPPAMQEEHGSTDMDGSTHDAATPPSS